MEVGKTAEFAALITHIPSLFTQTGPKGIHQCNLPIGKTINELTSDNIEALSQELPSGLKQVLYKILYRSGELLFV